MSVIRGTDPCGEWFHVLGDKSLGFRVNSKGFCVYLGSKVTGRANDESEFSACFGRNACLFLLLKKKKL